MPLLCRYCAAAPQNVTTPNGDPPPGLDSYADTKLLAKCKKSDLIRVRF